MKSKIVTYWITTALLAGFMASSAYAYLTHDPKALSAFASLGYPMYFPLVLGVAKLLGSVTLVVPGFPRLKEWAYAGFTFTFIGAFFSHLAADQAAAAVMPLISLLILGFSYACRPAPRRIARESEVDVPDHPLGGLPAR